MTIFHAKCNLGNKLFLVSLVLLFSLTACKNGGGGSGSGTGSGGSSNSSSNNSTANSTANSNTITSNGGAVVPITSSSNNNQNTSDNKDNSNPPQATPGTTTGGSGGGSINIIKYVPPEPCSKDLNSYGHPISCTCDYSYETYNSQKGVCEKTPLVVNSNCSVEKNEFGFPKLCLCKTELSYNPKNGLCEEQIIASSDKIIEFQETLSNAYDDILNRKMSESEWMSHLSDIQSGRKSVDSISSELLFQKSLNGVMEKKNLYYMHGNNICLGKWSYQLYNIDSTNVCPVETRWPASNPICGVETYNLARTSVCGVQTYNLREHPNCGVAEWNSCNNTSDSYDICGLGSWTESSSFENYATYINTDTPNPDNNPFPSNSLRNRLDQVCIDRGNARGQSWHNRCNVNHDYTHWGFPNDWGSSLACLSKDQSFQADYYNIFYNARAVCHVVNSCPHSSCGVKRYNSCRIPENGIELYNYCRHPNHGVETYKTCVDNSNPIFAPKTWEYCRHQNHGIDDSIFETGNGASLNYILSLKGVAGSNNVDASLSTVTCSTCDDLPVSLSDVLDINQKATLTEKILVQNKYSCLLKHLGSEQNIYDPLILESIRKLKLLMASKSSLLSSDKLNVIKDFVIKYPTTDYALNRDLYVIPQECQDQKSKLIVDALKGMGRICEFDYISSRPLTPDFANVCLNVLFSKLNELKTQNVSCASKLRLAVSQKTLNIIIKQIDSLTLEKSAVTNELSLSETPLRSVIENLSRLINMEMEFSPASDLKYSYSLDQLESVTGKIIGKIISLRKAELVIESPKPSILYNDYTFLLKTVFNVSGAIKIAIPDSLVLQVMTDTLTPISDRVKSFTALYDMVCSINDCRNKTFDTLSIIKFISKLDNKVELDTIYKQNAFSLKLQPLFTLLHDKRDWLETTLTSSLSSNLNDPKDILLQKNRIKTRLYFLINRNRIDLSRFEKSGLFSGKLYNQIDVAFSSDVIQKIKERKDTLIGSLNGEVTKYEGLQNSVINSLINETSVDNQKSVLMDRFNKELYEYNRISTNIINQQFLLNSDEIQLSNYHTQFTSAIFSDVYQNVYKELGVVSQIKNLSINPLSYAQFDGIENKSREEVIKSIVTDNSKWRVEASGRDTINIEITGDWSPSCAIKKEYASLPSLSIPLTGPEGYNQTVQNNETQVVSNSNFIDHQDYNSEDLVNSDCEIFNNTFSLSTGGSTTNSFSNIAYINADNTTSWGKIISKCKNKIDGSRDSSGNSQKIGADSQTGLSSNFNTGIRSKFTPFPEFAAGSLLLVGIKYKDLNELPSIVDIRSLNRTNSIIVQSDATYFFVVNDCVGSSNRPLDLKITHLRPMESMAVKTYDAIISALKDLDITFTTKLKEMTSISESELSLLEKGLTSKLAEKGVERGKNPLLDQLFDYWIANKVVQIKRKIEINKLQELRFMAKQTMFSTANEINRTLNISDLYQKNLTRLFENYDYDKLGDKLTRVIDFAYNLYLPSVKFKYPNITNDDLFNKESNKKLLNISIDDNVKEIATVVMSFIDDLSDKVGNLDIRKSPSTSSIVGIRFPRPNHLLNGYDTVVDDFFNSINSIYPQASLAASKSVWDHLTGKSSSASFSINIDDIYSDYSVGTLDCAQSAPIINGMGLFFVMNDTIEAQRLNDLYAGNPKKITMGANTLYALESGPESYLISDSSWTTPLVPLIFGPIETAYVHLKSNLNLSDNHPGYGLSPFTSYKIELSSLFSTSRFKSNISNMSDVLLILSVDTHNDSKAMNWVKKCIK